MSTREDAIRFLTLELERQKYGSTFVVPAVVDILITNPDLCLSLIWANQDARNGILDRTAQASGMTAERERQPNKTPSVFSKTNTE